MTRRALFIWPCGWVAEKAAIARAEGQKGDTDEMMVEEAAPIRLGYILNASRAEEFNQWMAFEVGPGVYCPPRHPTHLQSSFRH
jgi:hypothetical protein